MANNFKDSYRSNKQKTSLRKQKYLENSLHRSFRLSRRRDYKQELNLPGYIAFTRYVNKTISSSRAIFAQLMLVYALLTLLLVGMASQDLYNTISDSLRQTSGDLFSGGFGQIGEASVLLLTGVTGGITQNLSEAQQIFATLILLLTWLSTVWVLRNKLSGNKFKLRDALYNSASPLISTMLVALLALLQMLPFALGLIVYSAASISGLLSNGIEAMLVWAGIALLTVLSLYWLTSTFMSLIVVTLPGMYPMQAVKTGNQLVRGRRLRILYRLLWLVLLIALFWVVVLIPIIIFDSWLKGVWPAINWLPLVPVALLLVSSSTVIWAASYIYLLYRKIVDDVTKQS